MPSHYFFLTSWWEQQKLTSQSPDQTEFSRPSLRFWLCIGLWSRSDWYLLFCCTQNPAVFSYFKEKANCTSRQKKGENRFNKAWRKHFNQSAVNIKFTKLCIKAHTLLCFLAHRIIPNFRIKSKQPLVINVSVKVFLNLNRLNCLVPNNNKRDDWTELNISPSVCDVAEGQFQGMWAGPPVNDSKEM